MVSMRWGDNMGLGINPPGQTQNNTGEGFLAQSLSSNRLLALLYVSECRRKGTNPLTNEPDWQSFLTTFWPRLVSLSEERRFEVLEAHLMSVEDIDIYNDTDLALALKENEVALVALHTRLLADSRFA